MPTATLHHDPARLGYHPPTGPAPTATDPTSLIAAAYPADPAAAQRLLATAAAAALQNAGRRAAVGAYGIHATCETPVAGGWLVLVPMADLLELELDLDLADEDQADPAVWHVVARRPDGTVVEDPIPEHACPSVLWAERAGIDPTAAVDVVVAVLGDPYLVGLLRDVL